MSDAIGTTCGAFLGSSTLTTYVESASGIAEGGRSGLTSFTTGIFFIVALFLSPLFMLIPSAATSGALVLVGVLMASDDFVRGQSFHKFTVKTLAQIEEEFKDFIILITFGTHIPEVMANIKALEKEYEVMIPSVPVAGECVFNRSYLVRNGEEIMNAYNLMADEESKKVFKNMCYFEYTGELKYLYAMESSKDEAFKILNLNSEEDYLDLGAYRGDTIDEFLKYTCNHYHSITALEPEPKTFKKLVEAKGDLENTTLLNKAVWSFDTELEFRADMGRGSLIKNNGGLLAETVSIDSLAEDTKFTYIKMDVEGVEFVVLSGGMTLMAEHKPKLNIACYHRCCDIYRLPAVIHRANPNYKIYMRHHPYIPCWDTNLYCI